MTFHRSRATNIPACWNSQKHENLPLSSLGFNVVNFLFRRALQQKLYHEDF